MGLADAWHRLSRIGTEGLALEEERKVRALNQFVVIAAASYASFGCLFFLDATALWRSIALNFLSTVLQVTTLLHVRAGRRALAVVQFLLICNVQLFIGSWMCGPNVGFHYYFFAFASVVFLVVPRRMAFLYPFSLVSAGSFFYFAFVMKDEAAIVHVSDGLSTLFRALVASATALTLGLIAYLFDLDAHHAEQRLELEHERSERLLLNILPPSISTRLKGGQESIADAFPEVSVVFADIVGFTELSARLPPAELVAVLNEVFSKFDELAGRHDLEKIKTIGDAYMVAAGLPEPRADHATAATEMALEMIDALAQVNRERDLHLEVRIGINSGAVVAGVIGKRKFIYDLWGDTVNTASRMESHGLKGAVHVSEVTANLIRDRFELEDRGTIAVKGKGEMRTFLVKRKL